MPEEDLVDKLKNASLTGRASFRPPEDVSEAVENKIIEQIVATDESDEES